MKNFKTTAAPGLFDVQFRQQWLLAKGNSMSRLDAVVDWELFRALLDAALDKPAQGPGGRPANDRLKMFKALLVQRFYNLSDEQTEYQINDRLSFQQFIGWTLADKIPDANTLWDFREALIEAGAFEKLFALFDAQLRERGLLAQPGKLVDASFVDVPRQRGADGAVQSCRRRGRDDRSGRTAAGPRRGIAGGVGGVGARCRTAEAITERRKVNSAMRPIFNILLPLLRLAPLAALHAKRNLTGVPGFGILRAGFFQALENHGTQTRN